MRAPGILLLLLTVFATVAYPNIDGRIAAKTNESTASVLPSEDHYWRYSKRAPFHDYLAPEVQQFASTDPHETAARVCRELGGEVGHIAAVNRQQLSVAFLCRFTEPDVTMSVDFGDLDRIPVP